MDHKHSTPKEHKKGKHLSVIDRHTIQDRLKNKVSITKIAEELECSRSTIYSELKRGTVYLYNGKVARYKYEVGQAAYEETHANSSKCFAFLKKQDFLKYVEEHFHKDGWSLDVCYGRALADGLFTRDEMVCPKTLYAYVDMGLLNIKNIDLPEKLRRKPRKDSPKANKKVLGRSIEERDPEIAQRTEFGHWECDLVLGAKSKDSVILTMAERMSRTFLMIPVESRSSEAVLEAFKSLFNEYSEHSGEVFRTITSDNGSEFSRLSELEELADTLVYFAHPYSAWERGTNERHNGLIRRFVPKGRAIDSYDPEYLMQIELWANGLPRKVLGYRTPEEIFDQELDRIYRTRKIA